MSDNTTDLTALPLGLDGSITQLAKRPAETITKIDDPNEIAADGPLFLVTGNGKHGIEANVIDVRSAAPAAFPPRSVAARTVTDVPSFVAELNRRPLPAGDGTLWANRRNGRITAVYNDLHPSTAAEYTDRDDRLVLQFVADPDWAALHRAADGNYHGQEEFGDLIESVGHLVTSHAAADLIEIIDSIRASSKGSFESRISRRDGSQVLNWTEEVNTTAKVPGRGTLEIPREVVLAASPFEGYPTVEVRCWLRLRIHQGTLHLALVPQPYEPAVRAAWDSVVAVLAEELGRPIYAANLQ